MDQMFVCACCSFGWRWGEAEGLFPGRVVSGGPVDVMADPGFIN